MTENQIRRKLKPAIPRHAIVAANRKRRKLILDGERPNTPAKIECYDIAKANLMRFFDNVDFILKKRGKIKEKGQGSHHKWGLNTMIKDINKLYSFKIDQGYVSRIKKGEKSSCGFFLMQVIAHYLSEDVGYLLTVNLKNIDYNEKVRQDNAKIEKVIMDMFNAKEF
jgi:hypothetical protein